MTKNQNLTKDQLEARGLRIQSTYLDFYRSLALPNLSLPLDMALQEYDMATWVVWRTMAPGDPNAFAIDPTDYQKVKNASACFDAFLAIAKHKSKKHDRSYNAFKHFVRTYGPLGIWPHIVDAREYNDDFNDGFDPDDPDKIVDNKGYIVYREPFKLYHDLAVKCNKIIEDYANNRASHRSLEKAINLANDLFEHVNLSLHLRTGEGEDTAKLTLPSWSAEKWDRNYLTLRATAISENDDEDDEDDDEDSYSAHYYAAFDYDDIENYKPFSFQINFDKQSDYRPLRPSPLFTMLIMKLLSILSSRDKFVLCAYCGEPISHARSSLYQSQRPSKSHSDIVTRARKVTERPCCGSARCLAEQNRYHSRKSRDKTRARANGLAQNTILDVDDFIVNHFERWVDEKKSLDSLEELEEVFATVSLAIADIRADRKQRNRT